MSARRRNKEPAPRWLTPSELEAWQDMHLMLLLLPPALDTQLQRDSQLSYLEYYVLAGLSDRPEHTMRISELALLTNAELSRISHLVTRLEKRGYVRRQPHPDDGRFTNAILTDAGYERLVEAAPGHVATVRKLIFDALDARRIAALRASAQTIVESIGAAGLDRRSSSAR